MQMRTGVKKVALLDDLPAIEDAFGAHKRIAQSIRELISTESGGKAIGLIGAWGGGKSTVINLLRASEKGATDELAVFVFDAWVHEGDPLRRTFLEKFITFLLDRAWINKKKWTEKLEELSRRRIETKTETSPHLTTAGVVCAVAILVGTIGLAMVSAGVQTTKAWNITGFVLAALPFLVLFVGWLRAESRDADNILRYFVNKQREINTTSTIENPDPTSVEFQSWFCELAAEALSGRRKILLVVDNLDRVDPEDALKLWSAMRTFVDFSGIETPAWMPQLWVLAAFDEQGVKGLWKNHDNNSLATTFLEKTFQIRFRIPSPILSDWRKYLTSQLKSGFPCAGDEDCYKISRIFGIFKALKASPTPRGMKVFVNQVGAIYRAAPLEDIPLPHMALYAALIEHDTKWDPTKPIPEKEHLSPYLGVGYEKHLAALYFNMESDKAVQVMFGGQVEKSILEGDLAILELHAGKGWFGEVVEQVVSQRLLEWSNNEPELIGRAAYICTAHKLAENIHQQTISRLINELERITTWGRMDPVCGAGIASLVGKPDASKMVLSLISALRNTAIPSEIKESGSNPSGVKQWVTGVARIVEGLRGLDCNASGLEGFAVGKTPDDYLAILVEVRSTCRKELWKHFRPACDPKTVLEHLNHHVGAGTISDVHETAIDVMEVVSCEWPWEHLSSVHARLQISQLQSGQFGRLMRIALQLRGKLPGGSLTDFVRTGWIYHHLHTANGAGNLEEVAAAVTGILLCDIEGNSGNSPSNPQTQRGRSFYRDCVSRPDQRIECVERIVGLVAKLKCTSEIMEMRKKESVAKPTLDFILSRLAQHKDCLEHFPAGAVVENYQMLVVVLDASSLARLIKDSIESGNLEATLLQSRLSPKNAGLFRSVVQLRRTRNVTERIVDGLKDVCEDDWLTALTRPGDLVPLVCDLVKWEIVLGLSVPLQDALSKFADKLLTSDGPDHIDRQTCELLLSALTDEQRRVFKRGLVGKIIGSNVPISKLITLFSQAVSDCEILGAKADDLVQDAFRKMLERRNLDEFEWMKSILKGCPKLTTQCPKEILQDFLERLQRQEGFPSDDERNKILNEIKVIFEASENVVSDHV